MVAGVNVLVVAYLAFEFWRGRPSAAALKLRRKARRHNGI